MLKKEKVEIVKELAESLSKCVIAIATDYRGLTAKEMVQLRRLLSEQGIEYRVAKNTLTRFASEKACVTQLQTLLEGPLALAFDYDDMVKPAKVLSDYIRSSGSVLKIKGGILGDRLLEPKEVSALANIPPRDVLVSQLLGRLWIPVQSLHNILNAPLRGLINAIQARIYQIEGGENA